MKIEIITTPNETLKESGFGTREACNSILAALQNEQTGHSVRLTICTTKQDLEDIANRKPDLVILAVKYILVKNEADIWLSDYFYQQDINFTGSSREVLNFDSNKVLAKTHLTNKGIKTAQYFIATQGQYKKENELPLKFPLFLKPLDAANGNGIDDLSFVTNFADYESKVTSLSESFNQPVLVEEYLGGREFTVAIIKTHHKELIVSAIEVIPQPSCNGLRILGSQAKKEDTENLVKIDDKDMSNRVSTLAVDAFNNLGARDFGRIDIKTNENGDCFFMEANLVPGMTYGSSYFPEACDIANDYAYEKVVGLMMDGALNRACMYQPQDTSPSHWNPVATAI